MTTFLLKDPVGHEKAYYTLRSTDSANSIRVQFWRGSWYAIEVDVRGALVAPLYYDAFYKAWKDKKA